MKHNLNYLFIYCTFVPAENSLNAQPIQCVNVACKFLQTFSIMTNNQLLDKILQLYLMDRHWELTNNPIRKQLSFSKMAKSQEPTIEEWRIKFLKDQLFADKFLEYSEYGDGEPYKLTDPGMKAAQNGWYVPQSLKGEEEKIIRTETIKDFNRSKKAVNISIIAIIVPTIISLGALWLSRQQPTTEEVQQVKEQVRKLKGQLDQQKTTLDSLTIISVDTLKKANPDK